MDRTRAVISKSTYRRIFDVKTITK